MQFNKYSGRTGPFHCNSNVHSKEICRAIEIARFTGLAAPFMRISNSCSPVVLTLSPSTAGSRNEIMSGVTTTLDPSSPFAEQIALTAVHMSLVDIEPWMVFSVGEMVARENMIFGGRKPLSTFIDLVACCRVSSSNKCLSERSGRRAPLETAE